MVNDNDSAEIEHKKNVIENWPCNSFADSDITYVIVSKYSLTFVKILNSN